MIEDGMRLQVQINGKDFTILNQLTDDMIMYCDGEYAADKIDHILVVDNLKNIIDQLAKARYKTRKLSRKMDCSGIEITELQHCKFTIRTETGTADFEDNTVVQSRGFSATEVQTKLSGVIDTLCRTASRIINPYTQAVRIVPDLNIVAIKNTQYTIVVRRENIFGNAMHTVLINREFMPFLYVDIHQEEGLVYMFNEAANEVCSLPYDSSFDILFSTDSDVFDKKG